MFLQTNGCIHVHPPPLSAGYFSRAESLSILLNHHMQQKPLVSKVHPQAFVTTGSSIFSFTTSSGIFRGRGYAFAG